MLFSSSVGAPGAVLTDPERAESMKPALLRLLREPVPYSAPAGRRNLHSDLTGLDIEGGLG